MSKPKPPAPENLASIDLTALSQVTGGTSSLATDTNALVSQVNDMLGSIKNINNVSAQQGMQPQEMMMFMMLLQQRNQAAQPTVTVAAPSVAWWGGRGWY